MSATLKGPYRVLRKGGELKVSVPDLEVLSEHFLDVVFDSNARHRVMRMMFGGRWTRSISTL